MATVLRPDMTWAIQGPTICQLALRAENQIACLHRSIRRAVRPMVELAKTGLRSTGFIHEVFMGVLRQLEALFEWQSRTRLTTERSLPPRMVRRFLRKEIKQNHIMFEVIQGLQGAVGAYTILRHLSTGLAPYGGNTS